MEYGKKELKNIFEKELQKLKFWDEVQSSRFNAKDQGYMRIDTASHGYLVVSVLDPNFQLAKEMAGFIGIHAVYLEEDCEAPKFLKTINV